MRPRAIRGDVILTVLCAGSIVYRADVEASAWRQTVLGRGERGGDAGRKHGLSWPNDSGVVACAERDFQMEMIIPRRLLMWVRKIGLGRLQYVSGIQSDGVVWVEVPKPDNPMCVDNEDRGHWQLM